MFCVFSVHTLAFFPLHPKSLNTKIPPPTPPPPPQTHTHTYLRYVFNILEHCFTLDKYPVLCSDEGKTNLGFAFPTVGRKHLHIISCSNTLKLADILLSSRLLLHAPPDSITHWVHLCLVNSDALMACVSLVMCQTVSRSSFREGLRAVTRKQL